MGWSFSRSIGASGGLIITWKEESCKVLASFKGEGFLGIKLSHKGKCYYMVNIYSSCATHQKRKLWNDLIVYKLYFSDWD